MFYVEKMMIIIDTIFNHVLQTYVTPICFLYLYLSNKSNYIIYHPYIFFSLSFLKCQITGCAYIFIPGHYVLNWWRVNIPIPWFLFQLFLSILFYGKRFFWQENMVNDLNCDGVWSIWELKWGRFSKQEVRTDLNFWKDIKMTS